VYLYTVCDEVYGSTEDYSCYMVGYVQYEYGFILHIDRVRCYCRLLELYGSRFGVTERCLSCVPDCVHGLCA
jgi:hypothetical protein